MKTIILALMLIVPFNANADIIPSGCYVADFYRTNPCWGESSFDYSWTQFPLASDANNYYGSAVAAIIDAEFKRKSERNSCQSAYNDLSAQFSVNDAQHVAEYNDLLDLSLAVSKKSSSLIKKLRKACGSKCSRIK